jgi:hypothetical protein
VPSALNQTPGAARARTRLNLAQDRLELAWDPAKGASRQQAAGEAI